MGGRGRGWSRSIDRLKRDGRRCPFGHSPCPTQQQFINQSIDKSHRCTPLQASKHTPSSAAAAPRSPASGATGTRSASTRAPAAPPARAGATWGPYCCWLSPPPPPPPPPRPPRPPISGCRRVGRGVGLCPEGRRPGRGPGAAGCHGRRLTCALRGRPGWYSRA